MQLFELTLLLCILITIVVGFLIGGYYVVVYIIKLWNQCDNKQAAAILNNLLNGHAHYSFNNDPGFAASIWENVKKIIGENRYRELEKISTTAIHIPLLAYGVEDGLPCIYISVYHNDEHEKIVIENTLINIIKTYLQIYGFSDTILTKWSVRPDLDMPYLRIEYARTQDEKRIINILQNRDQNAIKVKHCDIIDDTEEVDLNE